MRLSYLFLFACFSIIHANLHKVDVFKDDKDDDEYIRSLVNDFLRDKQMKNSVITWIKDQIDPEHAKTYLKMSETDQECLLNGIKIMKSKMKLAISEFNIDHEILLDAAMEFVEKYCPKIYDKSHAIYSWYLHWIKEILDFMKDFNSELPASIQAHFTKLWEISEDENDDHEEQNILLTYDALYQILNFLEFDRVTLGKKHPFLAPFVTGRLYNSSFMMVKAVKHYLEHGEFENEEFIDFLDAMEIWQRPEKVMTESLDRIFTIALGQLYDSMNFDSIGEMFEKYEENCIYV
uniref:Uncharacterized protein n=1 Tax=Acrobeloides nanus TaxID=290746 RepID=A0A914BV61_9BILA